MKLTPEKMRVILYESHDVIQTPYWHEQHNRERYLYQYLNRSQPHPFGNCSTMLRKKIINVHGYPKVVSRHPGWRQFLGADKNYVATPQNTQYPIAWLKPK